VREVWPTGNEMSNMWDYRFAFRIEKRDDVPVGFRNVYGNFLELAGLALYGLFSPAAEDSRSLFSWRVPSRLILMFAERIVVLSLDRHSNQVQTFELNRHDFLGYGLADFLLNCWFTVYRTVTPDSGLPIQFSSRASHLYAALARLLVGWTESKADRNMDARVTRVHGLPLKFANYLQTHDEFGPTNEFFFQPAVDLRKTRGDRGAISC